MLAKQTIHANKEPTETSIKNIDIAKISPVITTTPAERILFKNRNPFLIILKKTLEWRNVFCCFLGVKRNFLHKSRKSAPTQNPKANDTHGTTMLISLKKSYFLVSYKT